MSEYKDFTSLPPEQEQKFVVYEKASVEAEKKGKLIAAIVSLSLLVVILGVVFSFDAPESKMAHDDLSALTGPEAAGEEAPAAEEKAEPAAEEAADEAEEAGEEAGGEGEEAAAEGEEGEAAAEGDAEAEE
ncbi:hypothetical protein [Haliangium ochraceum]|uniref:Uncharacterized protein n=1 Tax=Haliangium ochraceum (strain DSM 14365 / JCM 11303 / SMP-2) TaxID=502025 RepID=D0LV44_HALO1|nr:hypothetical protein [Haliangium ochraceum]ACY15885.1 hypothetical protein Hoch_3383 [Haliangium ochraceum DSM 14365]